MEQSIQVSYQSDPNLSIHRRIHALLKSARKKPKAMQSRQTTTTEILVWRLCNLKFHLDPAFTKAKVT